MRHAFHWKISAATLALMAAALAGGGARAQNTVGFDAILRNPGDVQLNMTYARDRMAAGDYLSAAAAMERLLFYEPNWHEARLLYAGILFQLGDHTAAERELKLLENYELSEEAKREFEAYRGRVAAATEPTRLGGRVSVGIGFDDNAGALITEDNAVGTSETSQTSGVLRATATLEHDLNADGTLAIYGRADAYVKKFEDEDFDGFGILQGEFGLKARRGKYRAGAHLSVNDVTVQGDRFLTEVGVEAVGSYHLSSRTAFSASAGVHDQEYHSVFGEGDAFAEGRNGERIDIGVSARHWVSSAVRVSAGASWRDKSADFEDFAYEYYGGQVGGDFFFGDAGYVDGDIVYRDYEYGGATARSDEYLYGRVAVGTAIGAVLPAFRGEVLDNISAEISVSHTDRQSTVEAFAYESTGAEARLIWRFGQPARND